MRQSNIAGIVVGVLIIAVVIVGAINGIATTGAISTGIPLGIITITLACRKHGSPLRWWRIAIITTAIIISFAYAVERVNTQSW